MRISYPFTRWFTAALLVSGLSACAFIIPPSPNEPRNNTVQGDVHKPIQNPTSTGPRSEGPLRTTPVSALPPVDNATQQRAQAIMTPATLPANSERRMPVENAQFQVSSNGYPAINSVPAMPVTTGPDSASVRLNATKTELEADRSNAVAATETLAKDAAAEPSMLSELPKIDTVPAADPIKVAPVAAETKQVIPEVRRAPVVEAPQSSIVPTEVTPVASVTPPVEMPAPTPIVAAAPVVTSPVVVSSLPDVPAFAPPAPLSGRAPEPVIVASKPEPVGAIAKVEPAPAAATPAALPSSFVVDLSPSEPTAITAVSLAAPTVTAATPTVRAGDFNPLAVAEAAPLVTTTTSSRVILSSSYASNRYIPPSRYSAIRN